MAGTTEGSFSRAFLRSVLLRMGLALAAMALSFAGSEIGDLTSTAWGPFVGGVVGLAVGVAAMVVVLRRTGA
ncbi:MAG: hypothetical protein ACJ72D_12875 [Marmoricola sp.]